MKIKTKNHQGPISFDFFLTMFEKHREVKNTYKRFSLEFQINHSSV